jgi:hypothetical protein
MQQKNTKVHRAKLDFSSASKSSRAWSHVRHADQWTVAVQWRRCIILVHYLSWTGISYTVFNR